MRNQKPVMWLVLALGTGAALAQSPPLNPTSIPPGYVPNVTFQKTNPNYPVPNPFYFEGKIDWAKLAITQPANAWEFLQRGMHYQDDLNDLTDAIADYQQAFALNSLTKGTCQLITAATLVNGVLPSTLNPMPCMFTIRLRLAYLLRETDPATAISIYNEVLKIDPLRLEVSLLIGEAYMIQAGLATTTAAQTAALQNAVTAYKAELALSPVTPQFTALTGDQANNEKVHWELAAVYQQLGQNANAIGELQLYLTASQWHSDVYPWRIPLAQAMIKKMQSNAERAVRK